MLCNKRLIKLNDMKIAIERHFNEIEWCKEHNWKLERNSLLISNNLLALFHNSFVLKPHFRAIFMISDSERKKWCCKIKIPKRIYLKEGERISYKINGNYTPSDSRKLNEKLISHCCCFCCSIHRFVCGMILFCCCCCCFFTVCSITFMLMKDQVTLRKSALKLQIIRKRT